MFLLAAACTSHPPEASPAATLDEPNSHAAAGLTIGQLGNLDAEDLRRALLGEPPFPSGWEAEVDEIVSDVDEQLTTTRLPDVSGLSPVGAACAAWAPLVGKTRYAVGAFVERQFFIAHVAFLAQVAPPEIRSAATEAFDVAATAAAEQVRDGGDSSIVSRSPDEAIALLDQWTAGHCSDPVDGDAS